jgi:hypothetical protein
MLTRLLDQVFIMLAAEAVQLFVKMLAQVELVAAEQVVIGCLLQIQQRELLTVVAGAVVDQKLLEPRVVLALLLFVTQVITQQLLLVLQRQKQPMVHLRFFK